MTLFVNKTRLELFAGATVADALRAYYTKHKKRIPNPLPEVTDCYGNGVAHDGALSNGSHIRIREKTR